MNLIEAVSFNGYYSGWFSSDRISNKFTDDYFGFYAFGPIGSLINKSNLYWLLKKKIKNWENIVTGLFHYFLLF